MYLLSQSLEFLFVYNTVPLIETALSKAWYVFPFSNTGILGSNPTPAFIMFMLSSHGPVPCRMSPTICV
jgi:hypothetical protein